MEVELGTGEVTELHAHLIQPAASSQVNSEEADDLRSHKTRIPMFSSCF